MNLVYLVCNKCEGVSEKDVPINFNKKNSKNSIINQNIEIPKDELLSIFTSPLVVSFESCPKPPLKERKEM